LINPILSIAQLTVSELRGHGGFARYRGFENMQLLDAARVWK